MVHGLINMKNRRKQFYSLACILEATAIIRHLQTNFINPNINVFIILSSRRQ